MTLDINSIPKYVINLPSRTDRLDHFSQEMNYMGWDFNRFDGLTHEGGTGFEGCAKSHVELSKIAEEKNYDYMMVMEDDAFFMPYAKDLLASSLKELENTEWDMFHLAPSIHRPISYSGTGLVNLSGPHPPKEAHHRGIFGLSAYIYKPKLFTEIRKWLGCKVWKNPKLMKPIDVFFDEYIYPNFKCYAAELPISTQIVDYSNINKGKFNVHYMITYNWVAYVNKNLPNHFFHVDECRRARK